MGECQMLNLRVMRAPDAPPHGAAQSALQYGQELAEAFALHQRLYDLARAGARGPGAKGKKVRGRAFSTKGRNSTNAPAVTV